MSAFEVRHFFSFSVADRRELRVRYPRRLRLGAALQVGFVRMTGTTLDSFDYVPNAVLKHVARTSHCQRRISRLCVPCIDARKQFERPPPNIEPVPSSIFE